MTDVPFVLETQSDTGSDSPASLLFRFGAAVDRRDPIEVADCFGEESVFRPGDNAMHGREAIGAFYQDRLSDPRRTTRHLWGNLRVERLSTLHARVVALLTTYAVEPKVSLDDLQVRIGDVECLCALHDDGQWRFVEHLYTRAFVASLPLSAPAAPK